MNYIKSFFNDQKKLFLMSLKQSNIFNNYIWGVKQYFKLYVMITNNPVIKFIQKSTEYIKNLFFVFNDSKKHVIKILSMRLYKNDDDEYYLVENNDVTIKQEKLLSESEKQFLLSLNYIDCFNIVNNYNFIKDSILLLKEKDKCFVYVIKTKKDSPDLNKNFSRLRFLSIVYVNNKTNEFVNLNMDEEMYIVGNELFSPTFIYKLLLNVKEENKFNLDYNLKLIDNNINFMELNKNNYIKIYENDSKIMVINK